MDASMVLLLFCLSLPMAGQAFQKLVPDPYGPFSTSQTPALVESTPMITVVSKDCGPGQTQSSAWLHGHTITAVVESLGGTSNTYASKIWLALDGKKCSAPLEVPLRLTYFKPLAADLNGDQLPDYIAVGNMRHRNTAMKGWNVRSHGTVVALSDPKGWACSYFPGDGGSPWRLYSTTSTGQVFLAASLSYGFGSSSGEEDDPEEDYDIASTRDEAAGRYWVHRLLEVKGVDLRRMDEALPGFPKIVSEPMGGRTQSHQETLRLSGPQKSELLSDAVMDPTSVGRLDLPAASKGAKARKKGKKR